MWAGDQAASVDLSGFVRLVANIRDVERSLHRCKLRRVLTMAAS
jgi:hypothetical protein